MRPCRSRAMDGGSLLRAVLVMSTSAQVRGHRMRLYQPGFHVGLRIAHGFIAALVVAGLVGALFDLRHTADWRSMGVLLLFPILLWALTTVFRTRAVYGSEHGLEFCRRGVWRTVPWSHVQTVEYTWWSFNRVVRIVHVAPQAVGRPRRGDEPHWPLRTNGAG